MIDILVYSERKEAIEAMVQQYGPETDVRYDWMPPGTMLLKPDPPDGNEYDEDNWYCNLRFLDENVAQSILWDAEQAYDDGTVKTYPSQRQPGVTHNFPYLNIEYETGLFENVYFTRKDDGSYVPSWPRRMWVGGA